LAPNARLGRRPSGPGIWKHNESQPDKNEKGASNLQQPCLSFIHFPHDNKAEPLPPLKAALWQPCNGTRRLIDARELPMRSSICHHSEQPMNSKIYSDPRVDSVSSTLRLKPVFRSPKRVTITLPNATFEELQSRADGEGRSLSNLAAFLLESSLQPPVPETPTASVQQRPLDRRFH